jgi:hypothetical protein
LVLSASIAALGIPIVFRVSFAVSETALAMSLIVPRSFRSLTVSFTSFAISRIAIVVSSIARAISSIAPVLTSVCSNCSAAILYASPIVWGFEPSRIHLPG